MLFEGDKLSFCDNGFVICDFDGTLINKDSETEFVKFLQENKKIKLVGYAIAPISLIVNKISRKCGGHDLLRAWSAFQKENKIHELIDEFVEKNTSIIINMDVLSILNNSGYKKILLTGSNQYLVEKVLWKNDIIDAFDLVIGSKTDKKGLVVLQHPYGKGKVEFMPENCQIGIGNEIVDRFFLEKCETAYVVNPSDELKKLSQEKGWSIL